MWSEPRYLLNMKQNVPNTTSRYQHISVNARDMSFRSSWPVYRGSSKAGGRKARPKPSPNEFFVQDRFEVPVRSPVR
ncbi:hypothetical protein NPIL_317481 [Nephila pilipes]|uniref:Uncharacterized protein n=1 Tax=Nephila pilipes TaxID=299642 RepID=A0A8X6MLG7_NEPPI|nr:hypothetical protein NPIL_317481 [Nephila pilipes]